MSSTDYSYDTQGEFFPFFIATVTALITIPLTYSLLSPPKDIENTAPRIKTIFKPTEDDLIQGQKRKQWRRERRLKRIITVAVGWFVMAAMAYLILVTERTKPKIWDPYDILEISRSSSEQQIKKRYRDLSRTFHPDKAVIDEAQNQTADSVNEYWVEVSKAFKALTDEEIRKNYIEFGHPDGKQSFSIGIALPKFIVTEGNGKYVLLVYGLLLGVLLPYVVGKWWYGTQRMTKEKVLIQSANSLFREYKEVMDDGDVVNALSCAEEYKDVLKGNEVDSGLSKIEKRIMPESSSAVLTRKDQNALQGYEGVRRKTAALLWAYLARIRLDGSTLDEEKYEVGPLALKLNESFIAIHLAFGNVSPLLSVFSVSQHLIQAVPPAASPLLQLPYITPAIAQTIEGPSTRAHFTIQQFMELPEYKRRKLATNQSSASLTPAEYSEAVSVARQLPLLKVEKAFFKVMGEKFITPSSLVQLVVKARVIPPGSLNVPDVVEKDLEDVDPEEGDLDALLGRKSSRRSKKAKMLEGDGPPDADADAEKPLLPPLAYAPYFPRDHSPRWHVFLADAKMQKVAVPPFAMTTFNKPLVDSNGKPTFNVQTFKMQFQAPPQAGKYSFVMHIICDSYIGMDSSQAIVLDVEDADHAVEMANEEDEISEPDEDSLAGQMNALKGGAAPPPKRRRAPIQEEESGSDTEGDEGDEDGDETNTDTEDES